MKASKPKPRPDLSGVDPLRQAEVMRRIEEVEAYLALPFPTPEDRTAAARRLGIGAPQFSNLVRAWQAGRGPEGLVSIGGKVRQARGPRPGGLPPETRAAAEEALSALPVTASHRGAIQAVRRLCAERGTRPPSDGMVAYMRMQILNRTASAPGPNALIGGRVIVALPVKVCERLLLPELLLALDLRDGAIRAAALDLGGGPSPSFRAELSRLDTSGIERIIETFEDADVWDALDAGCRDPQSRFSTGRMLAKVLGTGIGPVDLVYRPATSLAPERRLRASADEPLDLATLIAVLTAAMAEHNGRRDAPPPVLVPPPPVTA